MRARSLEYGRFEGARQGVERGVVGIGEPLGTNPEDLSEAILATIDEHGEKAGLMLERFADLPEGVFVWTMTGEESFRLGKISGPWIYDKSPAARATGIRQVRPASWLPEDLDLLLVPRAVATTFARGGRNFQRIHDEECERLTYETWMQG